MQFLATIIKFGWPYLRRYWVRLTLGIVLSVLFGISNAGFVWGTKTVLDRMSPDPASALTVEGDGAAVSTMKRIQIWTNDRVDRWLPRTGRPLDGRQILGGLLLLPLLISFRGGTKYLSTYFMSWVSEKVTNDLRYDVLAKVNSLSIDYFNRSTMGDLIMRINGDTATFYRCLSSGFADLVREPMTLVSVFVSLCVLDWRLAIVANVFMPAVLIPIVILGRKAREAAVGGGLANINQSSLVVEMIAGIRMVKAYGLETLQARRFQGLSEERIHAALKATRARELINPIIETLSMFGLGAILIYVFKTERTTPDMVAFLAGMLIFYTPIRKLASLHILFQETSFGVGRLIQVFQEQPSVKDTETPVEFDGFKQSLEIKNLGFAYIEAPVLEGVHVVIPRGFKLGIAGESGSGKSTLVNLLLRYYDPSGGEIFIDGINLRDISLKDLRAEMALVSQEVVIFDQSAAENIGCGKEGATRDEIVAAGRAANAHEFISALPEGYDTRLGERGVTLSAGQRQRLSIARAFIRDAPILILDEATASLDSKAEAEVQASIDRLAEHRTVICVAHRLSTLATTDGILVFEGGHIVERGTFAELLALGGTFASMAARQGIRSDVSGVASQPQP